jgi:hypothetical protein
MPTRYEYPTHAEETEWRLPAAGEATFTWDYDPSSEALLQLYGRAKGALWDADSRIDWTLSVDPDDPMQLDERVLPLHGTTLWERLSSQQRSALRYHSQVFDLSQFLHGEQGALLCSARIVKDVPRIESKFYAATQVMDEARHVEVYRRLLVEKFRFMYPVAGSLKTLLEQALGDSRWDFTYLGMQVLIEGSGLVAFQRMRDYSRSALCSSIAAYVMQDEARHVAFGRLALRDFYPELGEAERRQREEFVIEGAYYLRDRFNPTEMWQRVGIDPADALKAIGQSDAQLRYRKRLFSRIVPTVRDIGLWSPRVQAAFADLGGIEYASTDAQLILEKDDRVARAFDERMRGGDSSGSTPNGL